MNGLDYETMGRLAFAILFIALFIFFGAMMYDQKKQNEKKN